MTLRILSVLFLAAGLLMAQRGNRNNSATMGEMGMSRPDPLEQFSSILKLNKDQRKDVKGILDEAQKEITPLRENMAKSREQIGTVIEAGKNQDEIDQSVKSFADLEAQISTVEAQAFSKIFAGLDADQKTNAQALVNSLMFLHEVFKRKNWNAQPTE